MPSQNLDLSGANVLLVDDNSENLKVLRQALEPEGYSIIVATSGETALRIAGSTNPELILLDVEMPGLNGFETCVELKSDETTAGIPVIFVTARADTDSILEGFRAGGVDYILKPYQNEEVLARVETHIRMDRLARSLAESNREIAAGSERKSRFLASMAHELRTPMNAIMGFARLMQKDDNLTERQKENLGRIQEGGDRLLELVNDILDLSKIEAGHMDVNHTVFRVEKLLFTCCAALQPLVKEGVNLVPEVASGVGEVTSDEGYLRQILTNLVSNALKFTERGSVTVRATVVSDSLILDVCDTGAGIPSDALDRIFEEFQQVEGSDPHKKGTGLGLAIVQTLTRHLGGTIDVRSEVGEGSTFTVTLPLAPDTDVDTIVKGEAVHA